VDYHPTNLFAMVHIVIILNVIQKHLICHQWKRN